MQQEFFVSVYHEQLEKAVYRQFLVTLLTHSVVLEQLMLFQAMQYHTTHANSTTTAQRQANTSFSDHTTKYICTDSNPFKYPTT